MRQNRVLVTKGRIHDGQLWTRLERIVRVESAFLSEGAITFEDIRRRCSEVPLSELLHALDELAKTKRLRCHYAWLDREGAPARLRITYTYD